MRGRVIAVAGAALVALLGPAPAAVATEGSVPVEVTDFVSAPDGLLASLEDFFGPGAEGGGIAFDDSTELGPVDRVFTFSPQWLGGATDDTPVMLANEWAVPVVVAGDPVGVAIVWINPTTVRPQLADFSPVPEFAAALPDVPAAAYLVHDVDRAAWLAVDAPGVTVLVSGTSGVSGASRLDVYREAVTATPAPAATEEVGLGTALSVGVIVAVSLIVILVLLVPVAWRRRKLRATE